MEGTKQKKPTNKGRLISVALWALFGPMLSLVIIALFYATIIVMPEYKGGTPDEFNAASVAATKIISKLSTYLHWPLSLLFFGLAYKGFLQQVSLRYMFLAGKQ